MTDDKKSSWEVSDELLTTDDPLLACLMILAEHFKSPCSSASLTERLPLVENKLTPELFIRAAKRAGLAAEINKVPFKDISSLMLPTVFIRLTY